MKHDDIQKRLSAYIEDDLQAQEWALLEEHLKSCPQCSKTLAELKKAIERIKSVGEVEPPAYLTQKIMAKVREEATPKKGILRWLLYPLHIKLPLEIAATVTIVITAVYIYHVGKAELKLAEAPMQDIAQQTLLKEKEDVQREVADKDVSSPSPLPSAEKSKKRIIEKPAAKEPQKSAPMKRPEAPETKSLAMPPFPVHKDERDKIGLTAKEPKRFMPSELPEIGESKPVETPPPAPQAVKEDKVGLSGIFAGKKTMKEKAPVPEANVQSFVAEKKKDATIITLKVQNREFAEQEIQKLLSRLNAKMLTTEHPENRAIISAQLDAKKIKELIARLKQLGEMKEKEVSLEIYEGDREISIQIETISTPEILR